MAMPPIHPPGSHDYGSFETVRCPYCGELTDSRFGTLYYCPNCGRYFAREDLTDGMDEPAELPSTAPAPDQRTRDVILEVAQAHPRWGRVRIHRELRSRGHDIEAPVIGDVLERYNLPNSKR